ncbi:MAG: hypothetical protein Q7R76_04715 [Candidatus Woesearchaeota archaeon]|nr:hypothetical protein [Candidatus Woesearchaeota archaeon]
MKKTLNLRKVTRMGKKGTGKKDVSYTELKKKSFKEFLALLRKWQEDPQFCKAARRFVKQTS